MVRVGYGVVVFWAAAAAAGCSKTVTPGAPDGGGPFVPLAVLSAHPQPSAGGIGWGASASGASHASLDVQSSRAADNAAVGALRPVGFKLLACYGEGRRAGAADAVRVDLHVTVGATGAVTTTSSGVEGRMGTHGFEATADASTNDDALVRCVRDAIESAELPAASRGTSFDVAVRLSP
jgi:hypothetical protein